MCKLGKVVLYRQQPVKFGNDVLGMRPVTCGTPQGSTHSLLLLTLYIDNVTAHIVHSEFHLCTDNLQIYFDFGITDMLNAEHLISFDIQTIVQWALKHGLKIIESKTWSIIIGNNQLFSNFYLVIAPKLKLDHHKLTYCDNVKHLG